MTDFKPKTIVFGCNHGFIDEVTELGPLRLNKQARSN